jgi:hypothetical protein
MFRLLGLFFGGLANKAQTKGGCENDECNKDLKKESDKKDKEQGCANGSCSGGAQGNHKMKFKCPGCQ